MKKSIHDLVGNVTTDFRFPDGEKKLRALILYAAHKCEADPRFGSVMLNKICFYSDFISYSLLGRPVTGVPYQRLPMGPAPKRMIPNRRQMIENGEIKLVEVPVGPRTQKRVMALKPALDDVFGEDEANIIDFVIDMLKGKTADEVSEGSHGLAWTITGENDLIPYQFAYLSNLPPTASEKQWADEVAAELVG